MRVRSRPWERHAKQATRRGNAIRRRVLIVCEDSKSSRLYFKGFPINRDRAIVESVGTGMNTESLVQEAVRLQEKVRQQGSPFSDVWCVFDRDNFPLGQYDRAFQLAKDNHFEVAWANEAFEL